MRRAYRAGLSSGLRQRTQEEILGKRFVEIVGDERYGILDALRPQKSVAGGQVQTAMLLVRNEVEHGTSIACHNDGLSLFNLTGEFGQAVLCVAD